MADEKNNPMEALRTSVAEADAALDARLKGIKEEDKDRKIKRIKESLAEKPPESHGE